MSKLRKNKQVGGMNIMMDNAEKFVKKTAKFLNTIAGWGMVAAMIFVVLNIILRAFFKRPILGTYEYTGFITALIVGGGIAYCLVIDGHIVIDFLFEKIKKPIRSVISVVINTISLLFMAFFTLNLFNYANQLIKSNEVSPTTQTPFYIFVLVIALCFIVLCLVLLIKIKDAIKGGVEE